MSDGSDPEFGVTVSPFGENATPEAFQRLARAAQQAGFDTVWAGDHVVFPDHISDEYPGDPDGEPPEWARATVDTYDVFQVLANLAGAVDGIGVGTNICIAPLRHPVDLVKRAFTLHSLSRGRFEFGVGVGWMRAEFEALDVPFEERGARFDEFLDLFDRARREGVLEFDGTHHSFETVGFHPIPERPADLRTWIGGYSSPAFRRVGEFGDGWTIVDVRPKHVRNARQRIDAAWTDYDRDGEFAIAVTNSARVETGTDADSDLPLVGSPDDVIEDIEAFIDAGATHVGIEPDASDVDEQITQIERFGREVIPAFET